MTFGSVFGRTFSPTFQPKSQAGDKWWLSGGIAAANCIGAYQAKGAADLAASYVNLVNPGTYNITNAGNAPTWNAESGWNFVAATQSKLLTGIAPGAASRSWSMIIRYSSASTAGVLMGHSKLGTFFFIQPLRTGGVGYYNGTDGVTVSPQLAGGVLAIAGTKGYRNGTFDGDLAGSAGNVLDIGIGWAIFADYITANVQAVAIYNEVLTSTQVASLTTAMAAL